MPTQQKEFGSPIYLTQIQDDTAEEKWCVPTANNKLSFVLKLDLKASGPRAGRMIGIGWANLANRGIYRTACWATALRHVPKFINVSAGEADVSQQAVVKLFELGERAAADDPRQQGAEASGE
jgi:hypothetical protein